MGQSLDWFPRVSSLLYFLAEFPSGAWRLAMSTYFPWLLRSMREGAQGGAPPRYSRGRRGPNVDGASSLSGTLLALR